MLSSHWKGEVSCLKDAQTWFYHLAFFIALCMASISKARACIEYLFMVNCNYKWCPTPLRIFQRRSRLEGHSSLLNLDWYKFDKRMKHYVLFSDAFDGPATAFSEKDTVLTDCTAIVRAAVILIFFFSRPVGSSPEPSLRLCAIAVEIDTTSWKGSRKVVTMVKITWTFRNPPHSMSTNVCSKLRFNSLEWLPYAASLPHV